MFSIAEHLNDFFDWISTLSFSSIVNTYWFLFFIEMPRYYILEYLVIGNRLMKRNRIDKEKEYAKYFLYRENPLISILVPGKNEGKHIFKMVNSLAEQTYRNYEIIVVDDGSDDDTKLICNDLYRAGYITHYLRLDTRGGKLPPATMEPRWQKANTSYVWMPTLRSTVMHWRKSYSPSTSMEW